MSRSRHSGGVMSGYPDTYYARTLRDQTERPELQGAAEADVAIIGAGLAGLTAGLELARAGRSVVILEAERVGWGASGRNGGFVGPGYATSLDHIAAMAGRDAAHELYRLSIEGCAIIEDNIRLLAMTDNQPVYGKLEVLRYADEPALRRRRDRMARDFGRELVVHSRPEVQAMLRSPRYHEALFDPLSFHIHPLNYARGLADAIEALGGRIFERSAVTALTPAAGAPTRRAITTANGSLLARDIVFATGGYTGRAMPALRRAMLPIATYVLLTEEAPDAIADAITVPYAILDDRRAGDYYRRVDGDRRLLWGGRITTRTSEPARLAAMLRQTMISTYPQLAGVGVAAAWSGLMAYARHLMPMVGRLEPHLWHAYGFGGHGLNTTAIAGRVVAEGILGTSDRHRRFEPFGLAWAGGPLGVAAAQLTYWSYQAMDFLREGRSSRAG